MGPGVYEEKGVCVCVCGCVWVCVSAYVRASVRACVRARVCVCTRLDSDRTFTHSQQVESAHSNCCLFNSGQVASSLGGYPLIRAHSLC